MHSVKGNMNTKIIPIAIGLFVIVATNGCLNGMNQPVEAIEVRIPLGDPKHIESKPIPGLGRRLGSFVCLPTGA